MNRFKIFPIRIGVILCLGSILYGHSCHSEGESPSGRSPSPGRSGLPVDGAEESPVFHPVNISEYPGPALDSYQCRELAAPRLADAKFEITLDGDLAEWIEFSEPLMSSLKGADGEVAKVWAAREEGGVYLGVMDPIGGAWRLSLRPYFFEEEQVQAGEAIVIEIRQDGVILLNDEPIEGGILVTRVHGNGGGEVFISDYILERVAFYPAWQLSAEILTTDQNFKLSPIVFKAKYEGNHQMKQRYCHYSELLGEINWLIQPVYEDRQLAELESLLAPALASLESRFGSRYRLNLIFAQQNLEDWLPSGSLNIWVRGESETERSPKFAKNRMHRQVIQQFFRLFLYQENPQIEEKHLELLTWALTASYSNERLGREYLSQDPEFRLKMSEAPNYRNLGILLGMRHSYGVLASNLIACKLQNTDGLNCLLAKLYPDYDAVTEIVPRWLEGNIDSPLHIRDLEDLDGDGLVGFEERKLLTREDLADSDKDGWSDFYEILLAYDPRNPISHPPGLSFDGVFGDWFDLVPGRVQVDEGLDNRQCPGLDISHYVAVLKGDSILLAAALKDGVTADDYQWQVSIDNKKGSPQGFKLNARERKFEDMDNGTSFHLPFRMAPGQLEIKIGGEFSSETDIQVSIYQQGKFCDDTPWFRASPA